MSMKTIAFSLQKGGTGKTSLAVSLAAELAGRGKTLLIDGDPQGNASAWIGPENLRAELAGVLFKQYPLERAIAATEVPGLSLLPSAGIGGGLKIFMERQAPAEPFCMQELTAEAEARGFRFCVIDLSPAFGTFERESLIACDEVITPIMPDPFGVDGLELFAVNLEEARRNLRSRKPGYSKIVISALDSRIRQHGSIVERIKETGLAVYGVPVDQVFRRAQTAHKVMQEMDPKAGTIRVIQKLALDVFSETEEGRHGEQA
jgi:chromosome partitioning protein